MELLIVFLLLFFIVRWYSSYQRNHEDLRDENRRYRDIIDSLRGGRDRDRDY